MTGIESEWKQHFPTYAFHDRDIVLKEYEAAAKTLESAERLFVNATNITVIVTAALGSLAVGSLDRLVTAFAGVVSPQAVVFMLMGIVMAFSITTVRYFADRHKAILFASRKVVVLRRMLGLSYGRLQLVLPNWRTEGADEPFAIKLFPGWSTSIAYPYWIVATFSSAILFLLAARLIQSVASQTPSLVTDLQAVAGVLVWVGILAFAYRKALYDTHERPLLSVGRILANVLRVRLVGNIEYVMYRGKLAAFETARMHVAIDTLKEMAVFIEDRLFFRHGGVSLRALVRAAIALVGLRRSSGGSTITQQVVRTLFIQDMQKLLRRKAVEIVLALWLERVKSKEEILELYFSSVRYERGVFGVIAAMRFFFGDIIPQVSKAQAFFLVERVSNVRPALILTKIDHTIAQAVERGVLDRADASEVVAIYMGMVRTGKLTCERMDAFDRLHQKWMR